MEGVGVGRTPHGGWEGVGGTALVGTAAPSGAVLSDCCGPNGMEGRVRGRRKNGRLGGV